jgi:deoxyribodipyrimidine photo-lyase
MARYGALRDFPPSRASPTCPFICAFGTISIRELVRSATARKPTTWLNELIWRDFYFMILDHFPQVVGHAFNRTTTRSAGPTGRLDLPPGAKGVPVTAGRCGDAPVEFQRLDAQPATHGGRLVPDQGSRPRLAAGRTLFAEQLNDFDLSANNGGWQWASSSGCDAQPYFRIFNPVTVGKIRP